MTTNEAPTTASLIAGLRAAGHTARQIATAVRVHVSTVYRWAKGMFRPTAARAAALATLATRKETSMNVPTGVNVINGRPVVYGAADLITAAISDATQVTITSTKNATGDIVWPMSIARELDHPEYGKVLYAFIDVTRLEQAPQLAELENTRHTQNRIAAMRAERSAAAMVPACDNCGDCAKCC